MIHAVTSVNAHRYGRALEQMFRLRHRVFVERLHWAVQSREGLEYDCFDDLDPIYLLHIGTDGRVNGCARLLPTTGPYMLRDVFSELLAGGSAPCDEGILESSRFAIDMERTDGEGIASLSQITGMLLYGEFELAYRHGYRSIVSVYDIRMERILRRAGLYENGHRLGEPTEIGGTRTVAGLFDTSERMLSTLGAVLGFSTSVFAEAPNLITKRAA